MSEQACHCGFGEEYFTMEGEHSVCTVCGGVVSGASTPFIEETAASRGKTILLVDDQPFFRKRVRDSLEGQGHQVLEAGEGLEAVRILSQARGMEGKGHTMAVDLVLLDLTMPGLIDGFQTLGVFKAIDESLPVLVLTSSPPTPDLLKKLGSLKAKKYLNKSSKNLEDLLFKNINIL